ncbi:MAG: hypothetical protein ACOYEB_10130 [Enterococcus lemanii]|jgi:hypothetical protein
MIDLKTGIIVILLFFSFILIGLAFILKQTKGLFWARPPQNFLRDRDKPINEAERIIGQRVATAILSFVPLVFIFLLILLFFILINKIK